MASDPVSASWHPALMPNSAAHNFSSHPQPDVLPDVSPDTQQTESEPEPTVEQAHPQGPEETSGHTIPNDTTSTEPASEGAFLDQLAADDDEVGGWDLSNPVAGDATAATEEPVLDPEAALAEEIPVAEETAVPPESVMSTEPDAAPAAPAANAAKHSSTVSFARTVSHEFNWNDDDDAEWNLQRTDTDPFKFMPANERTNSFPVVPSAPSPENEQPLDHAIPATQAEEIMQEVEQEAHHDESAADEPEFLRSFDDGPAAGQEQHEDSFFQQQSLGGDTVGPEQEASDARFEEGLPLIPHNEAEEPIPAEEDSKLPGFDDTFADEAPGDDFFSQIQENQTPDDPSPALQRKDTSMFIETTANAAVEPDTPVIPETDNSQADFMKQEADRAATEAGATEASSLEESKPGESNELDAKWAAAFEGDDEDEFLLEDSADKEIDPAAFFGSDDEGFLEDEDDAPVAAPATSQPASTQAPTAPITGRYTPAALPSPAQPVLNTFNAIPAPSATQQGLAAHPPQYGVSTLASPMGQAYGAPATRPEVSKAQSFVDKKGGYSSPYDLPMDVVTAPRKRVSMQQLPRANLAPSAPPPGPPARAASMYSQPSPTMGSSGSVPTPPTSSHSNQPVPGLKPAPQLTSKSGFFEDLPMTSKPRPASRQNSLPSPQQTAYAQSPQGPPVRPPQGVPMGPPPIPPPMASPVQQQPAGLAGLVPPEQMSPYSQLQSNGPQQATAPASNRYSPAPGQGPTTNGMSPPTAATSRYSPAPPSRSSSGAYSAVPPPILAHQPRTSSPLAHFEKSQDPSQKLPSPGAGQGAPLARSVSSQYEPRLTRVPSLPPTREVEEDGPTVLMQSPPPMTRPHVPSAESRYSPQQARRTPPPVLSPASSTLSPPKRMISNYAPGPVPQATVPANQVNFAPPPRSQTQSPGSLYGRASPTKPADAIPRPSSAQGPTSPRAPPQSQPARPPVTRARGMSQALNLVAPTDGRELDPLTRWRGAPLISWGVGGAMVTSFPKDVPRYGMNQALPMILRSPGEVNIKHAKDVQLIEERITKFPGPLKGKSKKKETVAWLSQGIETLESALPNAAFQQYVSHEDKRAVERVLLWKILRLFVENDGVLEGNPAVEKAVRQVLSPELEDSNGELASPIMTAGDLHGISALAGMQSDAVDSSAMEQIRKFLQLGDREKAVWAAVDKRLWGHAMLISNTVQGDLYKQVTQEFIKKEVNDSSRSNQSLGALYGVLSGNLEEAVDALVPSHARAGRQLMSTTSGNSTDALAGLEKWRETLGLVLSNRSEGDIVALTSLGKLLSEYGRAEAAHICFLFARKHAVFGGLDDPNANFVLVGADHRRQADQFAKEIEPLLLSEVYEYGLALSGSNTQQSCPHLAGYKLQHAMTLAEYGSRDKALQYCEAIMTSITAQTRRSPYYHPGLMSAVDDLMVRLKQLPKEGSSSWLPKPSVEKVSSTMWDKFNKFVAGDDAQSSGPGSPGEPGLETGPFARIAGGTPTISRSPSASNFESFGNTGPSPVIPANKASSRYAPISGQPAAAFENSSAYAPRSSMERSSGEYQRSSYELPRPASEAASPMYGASVESNSMATFGYQPVPSAGIQASASPYAPNPPAGTPSAPPFSSTNSYSPYQPTLPQESSPANTTQTPEDNPEIAVNDVTADTGYQAPSYGYEPPTMNSFDHAQPQIDEPASATTVTQDKVNESGGGGGWEPPTYQPFSYEPPTSSYEPDPEDGEADSEKPKPKKSFMDDDDDFPSMKPAASASSKSEKDKENEEMFRKAAEEDAKRAEAAKAQKKGWFGGWFGGEKKKEAEMPGAKAVRANLGEASSFVYDPDQKRWVNKKPGADNAPAKTATPPPPRSASRNGTPPPPGGSSSAPPPSRGAGTPPPPPGGASPMGIPRSVSNLTKMASNDSLAPPGPALGGPPAMSRSFSNMSNVSNVSSDSAPPGPAGPPSAPPSRPATSLSNASSIDDLLGAAGPRKAGKKPRKSGRYVDVMAK
ncbi:hypothetical protein JX265_009839 [Neoarthrinium moseri]|uniref:Protein transport protein sec16 n=1 Tax=Neoarthrinium moseri TaxID=1658444 RepID=A0A9P9WF35_9PEZI|nr:hypothetical protein JX265_009839 [Neoarthrinium moseri]